MAKVPAVVAFRQFCVLCAKTEELEEVRKICDERFTFDAASSKNFGDHVYLIPGDQKKRKLMVALSGMGHVKAAVRSAQILSRHAPSVIAFVGTAASIRPDILQLGDVVIPKKMMFRAYDKISQKGQRDFDARVSQPTFKEVFFEDNALVADAETEELTHEAQAMIAPLVSAKISFHREPGDTIRIGEKDYKLREPKIHFDMDMISCGMVVDSVSYRDFLIHISDNMVRKATAIDMESFGFFKAMHTKQYPCQALMIRGISDYAGRKQQTEDGGGEHRPEGWKTTAAHNAALAAVEFFQLLANRENRRVSQQLPTP